MCLFRVSIILLQCMVFLLGWSFSLVFDLCSFCITKAELKNIDLETLLKWLCAAKICAQVLVPGYHRGTNMQLTITCIRMNPAICITYSQKKSAIVIHATCFTPANYRHEDYSQPTHDTKLQNSIKGLLHKLLHISSSKRVLHEHLVGNVQLAHHFSQSLAIIFSIWSGIWLPIWKEVVMDHR